MNIFVGAGELSGDNILASLLQGLRSHHSEIEIQGFGGPLSEAQGLHSLIPIRNLAVNGVGDILRRSVSLVTAYWKLKRALRTFKPDLVLLVDYPGMNIGLARAATRWGYPVHYVAPPQLWAYRQPEARLRRLRKALQGVSLQVLFPFERDLYAPWAAKLCQGHFFSAPALIPPSGDRLLLCPGSRRDVVRRNLKVWLELLSEWQGGIDVLTPEFLTEDVDGLIQGRSGFVVLNDAELAYPRAAMAIAFPGTMTLELFLRRIPTFVWAVLDPLTFKAGQKKLKHRFTALPNLLLDREVFPEWVGTAKDLNHRKPSMPGKNPRLISEDDLTLIREKMGSADGVATGVQACLELLL